MRSRIRPPSRETERELFAAGHTLVAGMDEVGRGALAGPVSVGVSVIDAGTGRIPAGLRDSKVLRPQVREALCDPIRRWSRASAVGHASAAEIDAVGIIGALRLAGQRALATITEAGLEPTVVILDGRHNWLSTPPGMPKAVPDLPVVMRVKADLHCASVAAASVLAKCERDGMMAQLHPDYPQYGWAGNKGYAAPEHLDALRQDGPSQWHRRSWALPGATQWVEEGMIDL